MAISYLARSGLPRTERDSGWSSSRWAAGWGARPQGPGGLVKGRPVGPGPSAAGSRVQSPRGWGLSPNLEAAWGNLQQLLSGGCPQHRPDGLSGHGPCRDRSSRSRRQMGRVWSEPRRVHVGRESSCQLHAGREGVPAESMPGESPRCVHAGGERAFTPSPRGERDSPRCIYAGRAPCLRPCRGPHVTPLRPGQVGRGAIAGPGPVLS